jgi:hypothetical protein
MLDLESGRALVPGSTQPKETAKMKVKVMLRFWYQGKLVEPGDVVEVDDSLGREIIASGKAVPHDEPPPAPESAAQESKSSTRRGRIA